MRNHLLVFFILLLGITQSVSGQKLTEFSPSQPEYIKELGTFMTSSKRKIMEEVFKAYKKQFQAGVFTEEEFQVIHATSNAMLANKMGASPYFSSYLETLTIIKKGEEGPKNFIEWHKILNQILDNIENRKLRPYKDYLAFSKEFFQSKSLKFAKSGVNWLAIADNFDLKYEENQPIIKYEKMDLIGFRKRDSIKILETAGIYYPNEGIWKGKGGKVEWDRFGLGDTIHVVLSEYQVETKKSIYEVKSAKLIYPELFPDGGIEGSFTDKIVASGNAKGFSFPRFESKDSILQINNIGGGVEYVGGFRLNGTTVYGYGTKELDARIAVYDNARKLQFRGASELFVIRKGERIAGERVETTLYVDQDSFYHPSVNLKFDIPNKELNLFRGDRGSDRNPFFNSLHKINVDVENIDWYLANDSIVFGQTGVGFAKKKKTVAFESLKYFDEDEYFRIQNISTSNPLATLKVFADEEGTLLSASRLAKRINPKLQVSSIESLLYDLVAKGFINYDSEKKLVYVKDKVFHYADASQGKVDYDYLNILSKSDSTNAVMSLKDYSIKATGVQSIEFSKTQKVAVRPFKNKITIKRNRDMDFDGRVFAGFGLFEGKDLAFKYDKNHIEMDSVRYFDLFIQTEVVSKEGVPEALSIGSRIEHSTGVLLIDAPANKSGKEDIPIFPSYQSKGASYVYYDNGDTHGGAYNRDSFYFKLDKFSFNNLDNFSKEDIAFKGTMVSAGIFPEFKETLVLQEDESLGFQSDKPQEGFPTYAEKGNYVGDISVSNQGFLGKGTLTYLTADVNSEDFIFKPNQMLATAERFELKEDDGEVKIPNALGLDVNIDWKPYQDSMYVRTKEKDFEIFKDNNHTLDGVLILTPDGLKGRGFFDWDKGSLESDLISFGVYSAISDSASIRVKAVGEDALALNTDNVQADLDFTQQIGRVKANADTVETVMPFNQYKTSLNDYVWNMKEENVTFKNEEGGFGKFTSIHPNQDTLNFLGQTAFYDLKTNDLKIGGVEVIQTCDAYVYTEDGKVEVNKGAKMRTLENAKIIANTINRYHVINRATVDILGKKDYKAKGFYEYNIGERKQEIEFADIIGTRVGKGKKTEKKTVTRATGEVKEDDGFYIDHKTEYRGKISLNAESKNLQFDGYARFDAPNMPRREWFSVKFEGDKNDLAIQYKVPKNYLGDPLRTGVFISKTSAKMYPSAMMPLYVRKDRPIFEARGENEVGIFKYNKKDDRFIFGDSTLMTSGGVKGNQLIYANKTGKIIAEGKMDIGAGLDYVSVKAAGRIETSFPEAPAEPTDFPEPGDTKMAFKLMAGFDALIPSKLLKIMATDIQSSSFDAMVVDYLREDNGFYEKALSEFISPGKDYDNVINKMKNVGLDLPNKYDKFKIFFSYLPMEWNAELQSLVSSQEKIGVGSIDGEVINRMLDCYIEFKMPTNQDDRVYIYMKSPSGNFYFFGYKQGILNCTSNNEKFNAAVEDLKKKEKIIKMDDGEFFEIALVNQGSAQMFVNRIRSAKEGN